jgi:hypothetical protein
MYSNLPSYKSDNGTVLAYNSSQFPFEIDATVFAAVKGFFTNKNFGETSADSIAVILISQAILDGYNPMVILDTLRGLSDVEISGIVAEILNYNRVKTSSLGIAEAFQTNPEISRNIIA